MVEQAALPPLGKLRIGQLSDVPRLGAVAAAAFYHSTFFSYYRPFFQSYPEDTLASYTSEAQRAVSDPETAIIVAEDQYTDLEADLVCNSLKPICVNHQDQNGKHPNIAGRRTVVGVIQLSLKTNAARRGQVQLEDFNVQTELDDVKPQQRDQSNQAIKLIEGNLYEPERKWCKDHMEITSICVHPAYWRKGHGTELVKWCIALSEQDQIPLCISASPMSVSLLFKAGFQEKELVVLPGYDEHPEPIDVWFAQRPISGAKQTE